MTPPPPSPFLLRLGTILNGGLALAMLLLWGSMARQGLFWQADFSMFYTAWTMVLEGQGPRLYDLDEQLRVQRGVLPERDPDAGLLPFNYPPTTAVPACVLGLLPRDAAFYTWAAVQVGLVVGICLYFLSLMESFSGASRALAVATFLGFPAVFVAFQMGQVSLLVVLCTTGFACALLRREGRGPTFGQDLVAAGWLVLATIKPQLALVLPVILLAGRRWRILALATVLWLTWAGLATLVVGPTAWLDWIAILRRSAGEAGQMGIFPERMYCLKTLLFGILGSRELPLVNTLSFLALLLTLGTIGWLWLRPWPREKNVLRMRIALSLQLGYLANPHFNPADAVVYALPAILYCTVRPARWMLVLLTLGPVLFLIDCYGRPAWPFGLRPFLVAMIVVAGVLVLAQRRARIPEAV